MLTSALLMTALLTADPLQDEVKPKLALPETTLIDLQPGERGTPEPLHVGIYKPKSLPVEMAKELVESLAGESVKVVAEPASNNLILRAPAEQLKQIKAVLDAVDQPPKAIAFEVLFADLPQETKPSKPHPAGQFSEEAVLARLQKLEADPKGNFHTVKLTALDNQKAMVQYGGEKPIVTGSQQAFGGRGGRTTVTQQRQVGTMIQCTARVLEDETILVTINVERSRFAPPEESAVLEESDDRGALRTPALQTTTCQTSLKLKPGQPRVISGLSDQTGKLGTQSVIVLSAEFVAAGP